MRADWPPWLGKRAFRTSAACWDSTPGTRSRLSNLPPAPACSADDGDGRDAARRRSRRTGAGRSCGQGGTGMRARGPPGKRPAACGTTPPSRSALTWRRAGADAGLTRRRNQLVCRPAPLERRGERGRAERRVRGVPRPCHVVVLERRDLGARGRRAGVRPARAGLPPVLFRRLRRRSRRARRSTPPRRCAGRRRVDPVAEPARAAGPVELDASVAAAAAAPSRRWIRCSRPCR